MQRRSGVLAALGLALGLAVGCSSSGSTTGCAPGSACADAGTSTCGHPAAGASCAAFSLQEGALACGVDAQCTADGSVLSCQSGVLVSVFRCPGQQACSGATNNSVLCGTTSQGTYYAKAGAPCGQGTTAACSFDGQIVEECVGGAWADAVHCPPSSCALVDLGTGLGVQCANGGYTAGDRCSFQAGTVVCSTDLTKILQCSGGATTVNRDCGALKCTSVACSTGTCLDCQ